MDECLDIVTGLWAGQPFAYAGKHYRVAPTEFPTIGAHVQQPRVPIWCVGAIDRRSRWRALRWDGILPQVHVDGKGEPTLEQTSPRAPAGRRPALRHRHRGRLGEHSPAAWAGAGATGGSRGTRGPGRPALAALTGSARARRGGSATNADPWNFADAFEALARPPSRRPRPAPRRASTWWASSTAGRRRRRRAARHRGRPSRTRSPSTSTTRPSTSSRCRGRSRPAGYGQHQLPLHRRRARVPLGQRRRGGRRVPRRVRRRSRRCAPGFRGCHVAVGRRRQRAVPGLGDAVRGGRDVGAPRSGRRRRGDAAATTSYCSTPAARPVPEGRHVAPGRPLRRPRRRQPGPLPPCPDLEAAAARMSSPGRATCRRHR